MNNIFDKFRICEKDISTLRGKIKFTHSGKFDGNYANLSEEVIVSAAFPRALLIGEASIVICDAYKNEIAYEIIGIRKNQDLYFDYYDFSIGKIEYTSLFFYYFRLDTGILLYGNRFKHGGLGFSFEIPNESERFQFTITKSSIDNQEKTRGIIYHIFVDRFYRTGIPTPRKDAVIIENWENEIQEYPEYPGAFLKNNTFYGGSIYGIIEKLDYIKSLGAALIYLSPIFESPSNHKYDTGNYEKVDDMFGGDVALDLLIKKARELGIGIILDGVYNHTGADSKYFNKYGRYDSVGAFQSKSSPYYDWYRFKAYPNEYESWWGIDILPRIYYDSGSAEEYFLGESGIVEKLMERGIKGFRLDVVDELSDSFIEKMRALILKHDKNAILYGEVWEDASNKTAYEKRKRYYLGSELSGVMNYPLRNGIISYIRKKDEAELEYALNTVMLNMPMSIRNMTMNIMGSHDTNRIITALGGVDSYGKTNKELSTLKMPEEEYRIAKRRVMSAYTILATLPGIPTVYYGDEAGVEGYSDPFNRKTFPWGREDQKIVSHFKKTGKFRSDYEPLFDGEFYLLYLHKDFLMFERKIGDERIITAYNNTDKDFKVFFSTDVTELYQEATKKEFILKSESACVFKSNTELEIEIGCY